MLAASATIGVIAMATRIRPKTPLSLEDARRLVSDFVTSYNRQRLHSAIGPQTIIPVTNSSNLLARQLAPEISRVKHKVIVPQTVIFMKFHFIQFRMI